MFVIKNWQGKLVVWMGLKDLTFGGVCRYNSYVIEVIEAERTIYMFLGKYGQEKMFLMCEDPRLQLTLTQPNPCLVTIKY